MKRASPGNSRQRATAPEHSATDPHDRQRALGAAAPQLSGRPRPVRRERGPDPQPLSQNPEQEGMLAKFLSHGMVAMQARPNHLAASNCSTEMSGRNRGPAPRAAHDSGVYGRRGEKFSRCQENGATQMPWRTMNPGLPPLLLRQRLRSPTGRSPMASPASPMAR